MIRRARLEDAPRLAEVHTLSWRETYPGLVPDRFLERMTSAAVQLRREENWRHHLAQPDEVAWVAEVSGELVGFASGGPARPHPVIGPEYGGELYTLYLLKAAHGQGLGRVLFSAAAQSLQAQGHQGLVVWVLAGNPARQFYRHLGGVELGGKLEPTSFGELEEVALGWPDLREWAAQHR
ncbi:GNAT family N-acetyltransferase [Deinococcus sonorensis]|uniref:GNAT family N-acetyltransferase n=2 Tax=Deinococcus sonorensis TaxID=309891 RepID=A0AAU7UEZ1_9DEIO